MHQDQQKTPYIVWRCWISILLSYRLLVPPRSARMWIHPSYSWFPFWLCRPPWVSWIGTSNSSPCSRSFYWLITHPSRSVHKSSSNWFGCTWYSSQWGYVWGVLEQFSIEDYLVGMSYDSHQWIPVWSIERMDENHFQILIPSNQTFLVVVWLLISTRYPTSTLVVASRCPFQLFTSSSSCLFSINNHILEYILEVAFMCHIPTNLSDDGWQLTKLILQGVLFIHSQWIKFLDITLQLIDSVLHLRQ